MGHTPSLDLFHRSAARITSFLYIGGVDDKLVCQFLMTCFRRGCHPEELIEAFSKSLVGRLSDSSKSQSAGVGANDSPGSESGVAFQTEGNPEMLLGDAARRATDCDGLVDAALALALHHRLDLALCQRIEKSAIRLQGNMSPAQISSKFILG